MPFMLTSVNDKTFAFHVKLQVSYLVAPVSGQTSLLGNSARVGVRKSYSLGRCFPPNQHMAA